MLTAKTPTEPTKSHRLRTDAKMHRKVHNIHLIPEELRWSACKILLLKIATSKYSIIKV